MSINYNFEDFGKIVTEYNGGDFKFHELPNDSNDPMVEGPGTLFTIKGVTWGNLEQAKDSCSCLFNDWELNRYYGSDASGSLRGSGTTDHSDFTICIPLEAYIATMAQSLVAGRLIDEMTLEQIQWAGDGKQFEAFTKTTLKHAQVIEINFSHPYHVIVTFHIRIIEQTQYKFDQKTGTKVGQNAFTISYYDDEPSAEAGGGGGGAAAPAGQAPAEDAGGEDDGSAMAPAPGG